MKYITVSGLASLFAGISGVTEIELLTRTNARARVNPFGKILKESRIAGKIGANYQHEVNVALVDAGRQPTFTAASRVWGRHAGGALIVHKGKSYLQIHVERSMFPRFVQPVGLGLVRELLREQIQRYLPARYFSQRQADKGLWETQDQIKCVAYALDNIVEMVLNGERYAVVQG